jgi:cytochrome c-type biogenesis protein CcmH/NrfG
LRKAALHRHWVRSQRALLNYFAYESALANARVSVIEGPFRGAMGRPLLFGETKLEQLRRESLARSRGDDSRDEDKENASMKKFNSPLAALVLAAAVSVLATPSFAQRSEGSAAGMSAARAAAIHECSAKASKYPEHTWGDNEIYTYRACMADHGQRD